MSLRSWGNYPKIETVVRRFDTLESLHDIIHDERYCIPYGNGRSIGDSALNSTVIYMQSRKRFLEFDTVEGLLHCEAGVTIGEVLELIIPEGWFLPVIPETKMVTLGGALASDICGKNHFNRGSFSKFVNSFELYLPSGEVVTCSPEKNEELFSATAGGMGLTGVILSLTLSLCELSTIHIDKTLFKTDSLQETFEILDGQKECAYSEAWIDGIAEGKKLGRGVITIGNHGGDSGLLYGSRGSSWTSLPFFLPNGSINKYTIKIYNHAYYHRLSSKEFSQRSDIERYFFPFDSIDQGNKLFGKEGVLKYHFVVSREHCVACIYMVLKKIIASPFTPYRIMMHKMGKGNSSLLSFPLKGFSLSADFQIRDGIFVFFNELDKIVQKYEGKLYLGSDSRMSKSMFESGYEKCFEFRELRKKYGMDKKFRSLQSGRVGI